MKQAILSALLVVSMGLATPGIAQAEDAGTSPQPEETVSPYSLYMPEAAPPATEPTQPALTGTVQQTQTYTAADYLDVQTQAGDAKHKYQQFQVTLHNKLPKHIEVLQMEVTNGLSEQAYAQMEQERAQAKRRATGGVLRGLGGLASIASGFIPYAGTGGYVAAHAISAGSSVAYQASNMVDSTTPTGTAASGRVVQRANNIFIAPNQQFQCLAVVPEKTAPAIRIVFKDLQTNQIFDLQK